LQGAHGELAVGPLVKLSRRHNHAAKLKRENRTEKQFFAASVAAVYDHRAAVAGIADPAKSILNRG